MYESKTYAYTDYHQEDTFFSSNFDNPNFHFVA